MKMKRLFGKILVVACSLVMGLACVGGVSAAYGARNENANITAEAADFGVVVPTTHTGNNNWLADSNKRILIQLPSAISVGRYVLQDGGTISLTRGENTWTRGAESGFELWILEDQAPDAYIPVGIFENDIGGTFMGQAGDVFVINGTFSSGTNSFTIKNATVVVNSSTTGDMRVEAPAIDAGYGGYVADWDNAWAIPDGDPYYPQMYIAANAGIPAGAYKQVSEGAIYLARNGVRYNLPNTGNYLAVGSDNGGTQQFDFTLVALGTPLGAPYVAQTGDILTVDGKFTNGTVTFEVQKTEIIFLATGGHHSVVPVYTVEYTGDGGNVTSRVEARHNTTLEKPADLVKEESGWSHEFLGWYNGDTAWDFSAAVTSDMTLTPKFDSYLLVGEGRAYEGTVRKHNYYETDNLYEIFFSVTQDTSLIETYSRYYAVYTNAVRLVRGGVSYKAIAEREVIKKYEDNTYLVNLQHGWTFESGFESLQDGDMIVIDGVFARHDGAVKFNIDQTIIVIAIDASGAITTSVSNGLYTATFELDGVIYDMQSVVSGEKLTEPTVPTKEGNGEYGYEFDGWYNGDTKWDFSTDIPNGDITLTAKFNAVSKYTTYYVENVVTAADKTDGFYFNADANAAPYNTDGNLRYIPTTTDAIVKISADGTENSVGNTCAETIVKYSATEYAVLDWAIGGFEDGATYVLNGTFKNAANMTCLVFENVRIKLTVTDGKTAAIVLRESFSMIEGAAVRLTSKDGNMGIRFEAELGYAYDENATYHMMIAPVSYLKAFNITENYYTALVDALAAAGKDFTVATMECKPFQYTAAEANENGRNVGSYYIRGSLTNVRYDNINVKFIGIAYKIADGVYTYIEPDYVNNARSLAEVASKALNDTVTYPNGNEHLEGFVKNAFAKAAGVAEGGSYTMPTSFGLNKTTLEGYPVAEQLSIVGILAGADVVVAWSSSDPSVASVDQTGNVIGISSGCATITATFLGKTYTCQVTNMAGAKADLVKDGDS